MKFRIDGKYELIFEWATFKRGADMVRRYLLSPEISPLQVSHNQ